MAEPFKTFINPALVRSAARQLARTWPGFDASAFTTHAVGGLEALELKARAMQIADALEATLPKAFARAAGVLERALAAPLPEDDVAGSERSAVGLSGWILWPVGEFVARRGIESPDSARRALRALHAITQRFTAEFAIRPLIIAHPTLVFETLASWTRDPSPHDRRLVSEGSRPRLPWGGQLRSLIADPSPTLPLLRALQDDESAYVRRSVANHLNDIAKDHPALVAEWLERYLPDATVERRALLRHASRTLIKRGDRRVLTAWGLGRRLSGTVDLTLAPRRVAVGESVTLTLVLRSTLNRRQQLVIDYAVHHVKRDGTTSPKVFKGWTVELAPHAVLRLEKRHSIRPVTTRRYYPGRHVIDVRVNGDALASAPFTLSP